MKTITKQELLEIVAKQKGTTFISIETETEQKLLGGKNCPLKGLIKRSKVNGAIGIHYTNSVNNQRIREEKEADFVAQPRTWGIRLEGTPLVQHKDNYYLEVKVQSTQKPDYFFNGKRIDSEEVKPYLPQNKTRQDLNKEVILRDYNISSIKRIKIDGNEYSILDN
jgi:hypothetical protein